jgi:hypothetical protein
VVAVLDQAHDDILRRKAFLQPQRNPMRHVPIVETVQQPHRRVDRDRTAQQQVLASVFDESLGDDVWIR